MTKIEAIIADAWANRDQMNPETGGVVRDAVQAALDGLDDGSLRVAEPANDSGGWRVNEWL